MIIFILFIQSIVAKYKLNDIIQNKKFDLNALESELINNVIFTDKFINEFSHISLYNCTISSFNSIVQYDFNLGYKQSIFYFRSSNAIINFCTFDNNFITIYDYYGCIMYSFLSNISFYKCKLSNNTSVFEAETDSFKGFLFFYNSSSILDNCNFTNNIVYINKCYNFDNEGGIIRFSRANGSLSQCIFLENTINFASTKTLGNDVNGSLVCFNTNNFSIYKCNFTNNYINYNSYMRDMSFNGLIFLRAASGLIDGCIFTNNSIYFHSFENYNYCIHGGIISLLKSNVYLNHCEFINNFGYCNSNYYHNFKIYGESIYLYQSQMILNQCIFDANTIYSNYSSNFLNYGCEIYLYMSTGEISECKFTNFLLISDITKSISIYGGIIHLNISHFTFNECTFHDCFFNLPPFERFSLYGSAVYLDSSNGTFHNCLFSNITVFSYIYSSFYYYGLIYLLSSNETFLSCIFDSCVDVINSNYFVNIMQIYSDASELYLKKCTFDLYNILQNINLADDYKFGIIRFKDKIVNSLIDVIPHMVIDHCIFNINISLSVIPMRSIFHLDEIREIDEPHIFNNNIVRFISYNDALVFSGSQQSSMKSKWIVNKNCISPYENRLFKSNDINIYDVFGQQLLIFEDVFHQKCIPPTIQFTFSNIFTDSIEFTKTNTHYFSESIKFTNSEEFTKSKLFSLSNELTESNFFSQSNNFMKSIFCSNELSKSIHFSHSNTFSCSNYFSKSIYFTQYKDSLHTETFDPTNDFTNLLEFTQTTFYQTHTMKENKVSKILSLSISFILIKSVTMSQSYNPQLSDYSNFPYIIEILSPTYTETFYYIINKSKKTISQENLIGIVCGCTAIIFSILGIIIFIIKKKEEKIHFLKETFSSSSDEVENQTTCKTFVNEVQVETNIKNLDDWL